MMAIAPQEAELSASEIAQRDRRTHRRLAPRDLTWIREVRLKYGPAVSLVDLSSGGALLQTDVRLRPGTDLVIEIVGPRIEAVPFRVLRSELARISDRGAIYQGACEFRRPLDLGAVASGARGGSRADIALKRILSRRRQEAGRAGEPAGRQPDRELPELLRWVQRSADPDDPLSCGLRDLLSELVPALDRGEPGAVLRARLEERLRRALPSVSIGIGSAPLQARCGMEAIYFAAEGRADSGVLNVELPEGSRIPDWQFRLLQSGSYLLELLPSAGLASQAPAAASLPERGEGPGPDAASLLPPAVTPGWQKIVVRYRKGNLLKGFTHDFHPSRTQFSLWPSINAAPSERMYVPTSQLKAVFFVRDFDGNPDYNEQLTFNSQPGGRRLEVTFADDEVLLGSTLSYRPDGLGFFVTPADARGNNVRVFVVASAIRHVRFL